MYECEKNADLAACNNSYHVVQSSVGVLHGLGFLHSLSHLLFPKHCSEEGITISTLLTRKVKLRESDLPRSHREWMAKDSFSRSYLSPKPRILPMCRAYNN